MLWNELQNSTASTIRMWMLKLLYIVHIWNKKAIVSFADVVIIIVHFIPFFHVFFIFILMHCSADKRKGWFFFYLFISRKFIKKKWNKVSIHRTDHHIHSTLIYRKANIKKSLHTHTIHLSMTGLCSDVVRWYGGWWIRYDVDGAVLCWLYFSLQL